MTYDPQGLALQIFQARHAAHPEETWLEGGERVALHVSNAETGAARATWRDKYKSVLHDNTFMPGGRIWYGSGRARGQLLNCVSGNTLVHTREGLVPARDLAGRTVSTLSQGGVYRQAAWSAFGKQELYRVEFANGDVVEATAGHQWVVTVTGGRPDQRVATDRLEGHMVPMQHLDPGQRVLDKFAFRAGIQHGLVYGDGTVTQDGKAMIVQFGDSRHLVSDYFERHTMQYHARYPDGVMYSGSLSSVLKQEIPSIQEVGDSYTFGFLAGYIAADGNVDDRGTVTLHSASQQSLIEVRNLASALGLPTSSMKVVRENNPWNGEPAPLYCLRFAKSGIDPRLIIKQSHKDKLAACPVKGKRSTARVVSVRSTGRTETVYCCDEPVTHTWVAGHCYLTSNCFVIPTSDSREGWGRTISDTIIISGTGGGVGINFSPSRPRGSLIAGTGGMSTGAVSEMEMDNAVGNVIKAGGGRRVALMFALSLSHGDIVEFMDKKLDRNELNNANVSVVFDDDPEEFFKLVRDNGTWELKHNGRVVGTIPARALWTRLVENAVKAREGQGGGEPGLLNGYLANRMSNIWYIEQLTCTNPCQPSWATVLTPQGVRTMADIDVGSTIWSGKRWTKVVRKVATGVKTVWAYLTEGGTFYGTSNHRVMQRGEKIEVGKATHIDRANDPRDERVAHQETFPILDTKWVSKEDVYDITVDAEEHTYWTGGLLVSNCGEIWMSPYDCCCLGAVVLPRFVKNGKLQWDMLRDVVSTGIRFLDDVLTVNQYPLAEIAAKCAQLRRVGLGVTGLHHMLLEMGLGYNTPTGLEFVDKLMSFIKNSSYEASSDLALEKGPFPAYVAEKFLQGKFIKSLKPSIRKLIEKQGARNCANNTIAPVGTGSIITDTSSGIEPIFAVGHKRKFRKGDLLAEEVVLDPLFKKAIAEGRDTSHFLGAHELTMRDHFEMQRTCQRHVDNAVSKTINLPKGVPPEELSALYMEYFPDLKGVTVYPDGSREDQPLTPLTRDEALLLATTQIADDTLSDEGSCRGGSCDL